MIHELQPQDLGHQPRRAFSDSVYARELAESSAVVAGQQRVEEGMTRDDMAITDGTMNSQVNSGMDTVTLSTGAEVDRNELAKRLAIEAANDTREEKRRRGITGSAAPSDRVRYMRVGGD